MFGVSIGLGLKEGVLGETSTPEPTYLTDEEGNRLLDPQGNRITVDA